MAALIVRAPSPNRAWKIGETFTPAASAARSKFVRALRRDLDWFLDDQVFARADRGERGLEVRPAGRGHADNVDVGPRDEFVDARRGKRHVVLRGECARVFGISRRDSHQFAPGGVRDRLRMEVGDHADSNDAEAEGGMVEEWS